MSNTKSRVYSKRPGAVAVRASRLKSELASYPDLTLQQLQDRRDRALEEIAANQQRIRVIDDLLTEVAAA